MESSRVFVAEFELVEGKIFTHKEDHDRFLAIAKSMVESVHAELILFGYKNYNDAFVEFKIPANELVDVRELESRIEAATGINHPSVYEKKSTFTKRRFS